MSGKVVMCVCVCARALGRKGGKQKQGGERKEGRGRVGVGKG